MDLIGSINWLAVVSCVVVSMISGMIWYNPKTFFMIWWKGIGKTDADMPGSTKGMGLTWTLTVLSSFIQAAVLAVAISVVGNMFGGPTVPLGMLTGAVLWFGAIAPTYLVNKLFAGHGPEVWAIETGNHLVNFILFGAILGGWR